VLVLGAISLFTDAAGEMIVPLRLLFFVQVLGTPLALAGLIEGVAEGATSLLKIVSGRLADRERSRRGLVLAGYSVSNLAKPLLALAGNWPLALGLVLLDRAGKATRASPRDAMLADAVPAERRGAAFGFHRSADTLGAAIGPLLALLILSVTAGNLRAVFGWTLLPGALAVLVALLFLRPEYNQRDHRAHREEVRENAKGARVRNGEERVEEVAPRDESHSGERQVGVRPFQLWRHFYSASFANLRVRCVSFWVRLCDLRYLCGSRPGSVPRAVLGARFWLFTAVAACFALGNSSDAFLFLRTEGLEASLAAVPLIYFAFNLVYALLATPLGALSDRFGRLPVLAAGYGAFALVYLGWAHATAGWQAWGLFVVYGAYYAATEGVARAFVADLVPRDRRGRALGWFNGLTGVAAVPANLAGAWLWSQWGPQATFGAGAWIGAVALGLLVAWWPWLHGQRQIEPGGVDPADMTDPQPGPVLAPTEG
jgi:MFS family permease